jgi:hypothetical protein
MKRSLPLALIALVTLAVLIGLWRFALTSEHFSGLRGAAQLIHLPRDFFKATGSVALKSDPNLLTASFDFLPKYSGKYQLLVAPTSSAYGEIVPVKTRLQCVGRNGRFRAESTSGRVEFDRVFEAGMVVRLITLDTAREATVDSMYRCALSIESFQQEFRPEHAYIRKLTDN